MGDMTVMGAHATLMGQEQNTVLMRDSLLPTPWCLEPGRTVCQPLAPTLPFVSLGVIHKHPYECLPHPPPPLQVQDFDPHSLRKVLPSAVNVLNRALENGERCVSRPNSRRLVMHT